MIALRCYCCGQDIGDQIEIVSMSTEGTSRVFVMLPEHAKRLSVLEQHETVTRMKPENQR